MKTAEEILKDRVDIVTGHPLNPWKHIIRDAMRELAAQETEHIVFRENRRAPDRQGDLHNN